VDLERSFHGTQFRRRDNLDMTDPYRVQRAVKVLGPEVQKPMEFGEFGRKIEFLPDEALQYPGVIGHVVKDFGGGHASAVKLPGHFFLHRKQLLLSERITLDEKLSPAMAAAATE
jgi:hypothetical protein